MADEKDHNKVNKDKRRFLVAATGTCGGLACAGAAVPFVSSMLPSARAKAAGAPVEVDIGKLEPGQYLRTAWRGQPVIVLKRTKEMLATLPKMDPRVSDPESEKSEQPSYCKNEHRSIKPEIFVWVDICTHLGCSPEVKQDKGSDQGMPADWPGGLLCPCHGSHYDLAARVWKDQPAPLNMAIPPYRFVSDTVIRVGEDPKKA